MTGSSRRLVRQRLAVKLTTDKPLDARVVRCTGRDGRRVFVALVGSLVVVITTPLVLHQYQPAVNDKA